MAKSKCSQVVAYHYGITIACLGASLKKLNTKQEALSGAVQREGERLNEERAGHKVEQMISMPNIYRTNWDRVREEMAAIGVRSASGEAPGVRRNSGRARVGRFSATKRDSGRGS